LLASIRLQFLQPKFQLLDLSRQFLRLSSKLHAMQLGQQQLQVLDLTLAREQLFIFGDQLLMLRQDQRPQRFRRKDVQIGQRGHRHARSIA